MLLFFILIVTEILSLEVLRQHFYHDSKPGYYISLVIHIILSLWLWILFFETHGNKTFFDDPRHIWLLMNLNGMICAVVVPRIILIICHFAGKLVRLRSGGHIRWLTNSGIAAMVIIFSAIAAGTLHGRFNFKTETVTIEIKGLNKDLDGLKIVQLSDMHLSGFYHHPDVLKKVIEKVNSLEPDLLVNTGDFISYGWREFERSDTILSKSVSRYGNFAILGNHDFGTYQPNFTEADRDNNVLIMNKLIKSSGYIVLNDEYRIQKIGNARLAIIGVTTKGRHPGIIHGDLGKATTGLDSVDFKILLSHDPNHWEMAVTGKTDINLTLSGHTHGMQMGIITKKFSWSPSKYFYPHWHGLFKEENQYQYVNRGLGVLAIPFRIGMPPEITVIILKKV
jgi:predicted MPP superfamily phosphohydrolase